jgi:hypothetical protein
MVALVVWEALVKFLLTLTCVSLVNSAKLLPLLMPPLAWKQIVLPQLNSLLNLVNKVLLALNKRLLPVLVWQALRKTFTANMHLLFMVFRKEIQRPTFKALKAQKLLATVNQKALACKEKLWQQHLTV